MKDIIDKERHANSKEIEVLKKYFPGCFDKEGSFNLEKFSNMISSDTNIIKDTYKMDWLGKKYSRLLVNTPVATFLKEDIKHNSIEENKKSNNLYIEGDNLEVLKHLTNAYGEKIKCIYIDPPYNTGKDFIYQDDRNFTVEELANMANIDEDEAKNILSFTNAKSNSHSAWLTFMYPRLFIARELLSDDGVIFISIDDNEYAQLKILCDEIFGEENFISNFIWYKSKTPSNLSKKKKQVTEYILCYERKSSDLKYKGLATQSKSNDPIRKPQNTLKTLIFPIGSVNSTNSETFVAQKGEYGTKKYRYKLLNDINFENFKNTTEIIMEDTFIWNQDKLDTEILNGTKIFITPDTLNISYKKSSYDNPVPINFISSAVNVGTTENGGEHLINLLESDVFEYPKPCSLIEYILQTQYNRFKKNDIILDFFGGSGTTAESTLNFNVTNMLDLNFIIVQLEETFFKEKYSKNDFRLKNAYEFCKENNLEPVIPSIAKERIKRAAKKIKEETNADIDYGFKVFRTQKLENSNYLDELKTFDPNIVSIISSSTLTSDDLYNLAITWKTHDGIALTTPFKLYSLNSYGALYVESKLYLMYQNFSTEELKRLLEINDSDEDIVINSVVIYAPNFTSKEIKELKEGITMVNKKNANIELEMRY